MTDDTLSDMEFGKRIKEMPDRDLAEQNAWELYRMSRRCRSCLEMVSRHDRLLTRMGGGLAVLAILFVAAVAAAFKKLFGG